VRLTSIDIMTSERAEQRMRLDFNPSGLQPADKAKLLGAALVTEMEALTKDQSTEASRETARVAAVACTQIELGVMMAVKALTAPR
jgi:hypothetical protein